MKHLPLALAIAALIITPSAFVHAQSSRVAADINADIRAEYADDLPKTYDQAITELRGGASTNVSGNASVTKSGSMSPNGTPIADSSSSSTVLTHTDATTDYVRVVYTGHAKLFGFIPVPVAVEVAAYADGTTRVALPWYQFLLSHDDIATVESALQAKIQASTNLPSPNGTISTETQQSVMNLFKSELGAHFSN